MFSNCTRSLVQVEVMEAKSKALLGRLPSFEERCDCISIPVLLRLIVSFERGLISLC